MPNSGRSHALRATKPLVSNQQATTLRKLGADLAVARLRRKESLASWAGRIGTSVPTLMRMEAGEAGVSMGLYATALWLMGRSSALGELAAPEHDRGALELDVRAAVQLGAQRARASASAKLARLESASLATAPPAQPRAAAQRRERGPSP